MTSSDTVPTSARRPWPWALLALDAVFFTIAAIFVYLSPCGYWMNEVIGVPMWENTDPGGTYVVSSLFFIGIDRYPSFVGHPGLTLQLILGLFARIMYALHRINGGPGPFLNYCTYHIRSLFVMGGLVIAGLHIVSFHALHAVARKILDDSRAAFLTVLAYATLFSTFYFATRISVEPILVTLALCTLLSLWNMQRMLDDQRLRRACLWAALAALAAVAAIYTKFHLAAPLLPFALAQLLLQRSRRLAPPPTAPRSLVQQIKARSLPAGCYIAAAILFSLLFSLKMDWHFFFKFWLRHTPGGTQYTRTEDVARDYIANAPDMATNTWTSFLKNLQHYTSFSKLTPESLFTIAEGAFVILAIAGLAYYWWASRPGKRSLVFWPVLYGLIILPIMAYRGLWHYFMLPLAFAAIFFTFLLWRLLPRLFPRLGATARAILAAVVILLVHSISIALVINSKLYDAAMYRQTLAPYHQALERVRPPGRIAVVADKDPNIWKMHGIFLYWVPRGDDLRAIMRRTFIIKTDPGEITRDWANKANVRFVIDLRRPKPAVIPIAKWSIPKLKPATHPVTKPTNTNPPGPR